MQARGRPLAALVALLVFGSCEYSVEPQPREFWYSQFTQFELLHKRFNRSGTTLSGSAEIANLLGTVIEPLDLAGTRTGDSLRIVFTPEVGPQFTFTGVYAGPTDARNGIRGTMNGGPFVQFPIVFRK